MNVRSTYSKKMMNKKIVRKEKVTMAYSMIAKKTLNQFKKTFEMLGSASQHSKNI